jgi:3-oxoacyl-[acyl-carrier-protein] synthase-1
VPITKVDYVCHNVSGEQAFFEELSVATGRLPVSRQQTLNTWGPATCVGEIGVAAGWLSIAMLAFLFGKGLRTSPALATFQSDDVLRGAAVVTSLARSRGNHG